ncbi:MFS transporter [Kitasatospora sp. NPDC048540]|uniref:MFS transporter n=1 Tax=Kitasatospora sp. NPDC048540 TaxID=3155634 RepID=UPI0033E5488F
MSSTNAARPAAAPAAGAQAPVAAAGSGPMLAVLLVALFMAQFDFFVVNVAAPAVSRDLHAGPVMLELIVGGYAFAYASGLITGGRLGDLYGYRRLYLAGMVAFAAASLLCGIAQEPWQLVAARLLQGFTAALMVPQVLATITATFPPERRPKALAWFGVAGGLGSLSANILGALMLDADLWGLGWRVIFLVNVLVAAVAVPLALRHLPVLAPPRRQRLDPLGALGVAAALALLLVPLSMGGNSGWPAWTWICMVLSLPVGALTLRWQWVLRERGGSPVLDLSLLRVRSYTSGVVAGAAFLAYFASFMFALSQFLQVGRGYSPLHAGLVVTSSAVMFSASALVSFRIVPRYGLKVVVAGGLLTALGLLALVVQLAVSGADLPVAGIVIALMLAGAGNGAVLPQLIGASLVAVKPQQAGVGAGVLNTAQQFGSSAGVSIVGAVFYAIAGPAVMTGGTSGASYARAMQSAALIDIALVAVVTVLMAYNKRASDRIKAAR